MQGVLTSLSPLAARTNNESTAASPTAGMASGSITVPSRKGAEPDRSESFPVQEPGRRLARWWRADFRSCRFHSGQVDLAVPRTCFY